MKRYWLSWYEHTTSPFRLESPWWVSGYRLNDDQATICAAVIAVDEDAAREIVYRAHEQHVTALEWRFVSERPDTWSPFSDRFPRKEWMVWPSN